MSAKDILNGLATEVGQVVDSFTDGIQNTTNQTAALIDRENAKTKIALAEAMQRAEARQQAMQLLKIVVISLLVLVGLGMALKNMPKKS